MPSPPPHVSLYDWPAETAAGVMVNAMGVLWARAATTMDAPTKRVLVKCMLIMMEYYLASDSGWLVGMKATVKKLIRIKVRFRPRYSLNIKQWRVSIKSDECLLVEHEKKRREKLEKKRIQAVLKTSG